MEGKRIFVSGGAGVIGQEMIPRLVKRGASIMVGDIKPRPKTFPKSVQYRQGDLNFLSQNELELFKPEIIIHLAATFERSIESFEFWDENFRHNINLSHHMMNIAKNLPTLKRVVFASSYLIYDQNLYQFDNPQEYSVPLKEIDPISPRNLIGMAKYVHEMELNFLSTYLSSQFTTVCARIFRGYGCNSRDVISRWIRKLINGEEITVFRPEGRFDYIFAADSAEGLIRLAESSKITGIINLGTGKSRRVQDIIDILKSYYPTIKIEEIESDIAYESSHADMRNFYSAIGWLPEYDLERGIREIIEYENGRTRDDDFHQYHIQNILITSASKKTSLISAVKKSANKINSNIRIIAADLNENSLSRYVGDTFWKMPPTMDSELPAIIEECQNRGINLIIPTRDEELSFWARNKEKFSHYGIEIIISPLSSVELCLDKFSFAEFGIKNHLPFIPTKLNPDYPPDMPLVVKERFGAGSKNIGLKKNRDEAIIHAISLQEPIFQPYIEGTEISIDAWLDKNSTVKGLVMRTRDTIMQGESQISTTFKNPELELLAKKILELLHLQGPIVLQLILDKEGEPHIIECNPRFGGASTTSIAAGLDIWYWTFLEALDENIEDYPFIRIKGEVRQIRIPYDIYEFSPDI